MNLTRVYIAQPIECNEMIELPHEAAKHLLLVLRHQVGDQCILFNGTGIDYISEVVAIKKKQTTVKVLQAQKIDNESPLHTHLGQAMGKGDRMDYSLQKSVELGVNEITPLITERVNVKLTSERFEKKMQHWRAIIVSAAEQSGRSVLPLLHSPVVFQEWVQKDFCAQKIICDPLATQPWAALKKNSALVFAIGPEGGLTEAEINFAKKHGWQTVLLGPRILRMETASSTMLSLAQHSWGDL